MWVCGKGGEGRGGAATALGAAAAPASRAVRQQQRQEGHLLSDGWRQRETRAMDEVSRYLDVVHQHHVLPMEKQNPEAGLSPRAAPYPVLVRCYGPGFSHLTTAPGPTRRPSWAAFGSWVSRSFQYRFPWAVLTPPTLEAGLYAALCSLEVPVLWGHRVWGENG